jgi:hypothetical protein
MPCADDNGIPLSRGQFLYWMWESDQPEIRGC